MPTEEIDKCKTITDIRSEASALGEAKIAVKALVRMMTHFHVSLDEALDVMEIPADQRDVYREMVEAAQG